MDSEFETITVVVGGNDCYSDRLIPDISKNYDKLINKAKFMCQGRVTMSSICPRLDNVDVQRKIELTNTALKNHIAAYLSTVTISSSWLTRR